LPGGRGHTLGRGEVRLDEGPREALGRVAIHTDHLRAGIAQKGCGGSADTGGCAGDDESLSVEGHGRGPSRGVAPTRSRNPSRAVRLVRLHYVAWRTPGTSLLFTGWKMACVWS